jgi:hypothetical protein
LFWSSNRSTVACTAAQWGQSKSANSTSVIVGRRRRATAHAGEVERLALAQSGFA